MTELFYKLPQDVAARRDLLPSDKLVYAVVLNAFNGKDVCWLGKIKLMERTGLSGQAVCDAIDRLDKAGVLVVERRGNGRSNHYRTSQQIRPVRGLDQSKPDQKSGQPIRPEPANGLDCKRKDQFKRSIKHIPKKTLHGSFVLLTDEELWRLVNTLGLEKTGEMIERLNGYAEQIGMKKAGNKYKSHYHTIVNWVRRDEKKEAEHGRSYKSKPKIQDYAKQESAKTDCVFDV